MTRTLFSFSSRMLALVLLIAVFGMMPSRSFAEEYTDFAEYLSQWDLVVEGTVTGVDTIFRERLGGCGQTGLGATRSWDIHIRVSRVVLGTAEDSSIVLTTLMRNQFPGPGLRVGAKAIAWTYRNCGDGWRLRGNLVLVSPSGHLIPDRDNVGALRLEGYADKGSVRHSALDSSLAANAGLSSVRAFEGAGSVALLRVTAMTQGVGRTYSLACDSVAVLLGTAVRVPRFVDMNPLEGCTRAVGVGDSLIVSLPNSFAAERLGWRGCSHSLLVKERFSVGFGVPLQFLKYAIRQQNGALHVRPFIARDE